MIRRAKPPLRISPKRWRRKQRPEKKDTGKQKLSGVEFNSAADGLLGMLGRWPPDSESTQQNGADEHKHGADSQHIEPQG